MTRRLNALRAELRAAITVGAGVVAALNFGKLPPALTELRADFSLSLVEVGWLTSLLNLAAALLGIAGGSIADRFGHRRIMVTGLLTIGAAGLMGALAQATVTIFASRLLESLGMMLVVLPGPALLQRCVPPDRLRGWLGGWGAYMPLGMSLMLFVGPWLMTFFSWRGSWVAGGVIAFVWAGLILLAHPSHARGSKQGETAPSLINLAKLTLSAPGPWILALGFLFYASQFLAVFSFLPTVYRDAGVDLRVGGALTALAVLGNAVGNLASGHLLQAGAKRSTLIMVAAVVMAFSSWLIFGSSAPFWVRYAAALSFSITAGLTPGVLFATVPAYAPHPQAVSTTVGLMQQGSGTGQALCLPLVAWIVQRYGDWSVTWMVTSACAAAVIVIALAMRRLDVRNEAHHGHRDGGHGLP